MRSVVDSIMARTGLICLLSGALFTLSVPTLSAQVKPPTTAEATVVERVETHLDGISGRGAARRTTQTLPELSESAIEAGAVVRYLMARNGMSAGEIQYVNRYVTSGASAAAPLLKKIDALKMTRFVEKIEVKAWSAAQNAYQKAADPNQTKKLALVKVRIGPFRTADGSAAEKVYVDWTNISDKPIVLVFAKITTYDAKGQVISASPSYCIYSAPFESTGIAPGDTYIAPVGKGTVQPFVGVPKIARAEVEIDTVSDKRID